MFWIVLGSIFLKVGVVCQLRVTSALLLFFKKVTPFKVKLIIGLSQMFMLGWHLFIILTTFFPKDLECTEDKEPWLWWANLILFVESIWQFIKCCVVASLVCLTTCALCFMVGHIRREEGQQASRKLINAKKVISQLGQISLRPDLRNDEICVICLEQIVDGQPVTVLPCNNQHFFHESCCANWLQTNPSCPLCKKEVTIEAINAAIEIN